MLTFKKNERLTSIILIQDLFNSPGSKKIFNYPFIFIYRYIEVEELPNAQVLFTVPKKNFKKAVVRNRLKRQMRELYRVRKSNLYRHLSSINRKISLAILYSSKKTHPFTYLEDNFERSFEKMLRSLS